MSDYIVIYSRPNRPDNRNLYGSRVFDYEFHATIDDIKHFIDQNVETALFHIGETKFVQCFSETFIDYQSPYLDKMCIVHSVYNIFDSDTDRAQVDLNTAILEYQDAALSTKYVQILNKEHKLVPDEAEYVNYLRLKRKYES